MSETTHTTAMRLFLAVDPSPECIGLLKQTIDRLRPMAPRARWAHADKLHVTLVFLGDIATSNLPLVTDAAQTIAARHDPFALRFAAGGMFGTKKRARVLWAGIEGDLPALSAMQKNLADTLEQSVGYTPEHRVYSPHVTLARGADPRGDEKLAQCVDELALQTFGETMIRELVLYRSETAAQGAKYTALLRAPLRT